MSSATEHIFELNTAGERRFYPRIAPSALIYITFGQINDALLLNVSENGVLVSTPRELDCNFVARLSMNLHGLPRVIQVHARVLWTSESQKRCGIQFINLSEHDREQIRKWQGLESSRESRESNQEQTTVSAQAHSAEAHDARIAEEVPAAPARPSYSRSEAGANDFVPSTPLQEKQGFAGDPEPGEGAAASAFQIGHADSRSRAKTSESLLAMSLWVAVPIVIALGIILLIRSGALPNPLAPSAGHGKDGVSGATTGTDSPDFNRPSGPPITTPPRTANASSNNRHSATQRNTDSGGTSLDFPATANDRNNRSSESPGVEGPRASANSRPSTASGLDSKPSEASDSRVNQPKTSSTSPQTVLPELTQTRATPDKAAHRDAPEAELSPTNELAASSVNPNDPSRSSEASRIPKSAGGGSYLARKTRPDAAGTGSGEEEVIEVRPEGHETSFVTLPGARVLEAGPMTLRIQRSVLMRGGPKWWPLHRSKKVALGELLSRIDPQVPQTAIPSDATVKVRAAVDEDGHVESVQAVSGPAALVPLVTKAVQEWRYQPTLVDGKPAETQADVEIQFHEPAGQIPKP